MERVSFFISENIRLLLGLAVVVFVGILIITLILERGGSTKVIVNGETFEVTVAKNDKERQIGLSGTEKIEEDQGMLFVFDNPDYYSFWMKEMKFPIDIIYINGDEVTTIIENAKPPSANGNLTVYQPRNKSDKVLEVNAGLTKKYNIQEGSLIKVENL